MLPDYARGHSRFSLASADAFTHTLKITLKTMFNEQLNAFFNNTAYTVGLKNCLSKANQNKGTALKSPYPLQLSFEIRHTCLRLLSA